MFIPSLSLASRVEAVLGEFANGWKPASSVHAQETIHPTIRTAVFFVFGAALAFSQDHQAMVNQHGDDVMGFSHEKTTHHFELNYDGGAIDVRANDVKDSQSRKQIRSHFQHIAQMVADGNFNAPMLVHGTTVSGTTTMTRLKNQLHWELKETSRGARINITADNKTALDAVHEFLRFQIEDHKTGDCPMVRQTSFGTFR